MDSLVRLVGGGHPSHGDHRLDQRQVNILERIAASPDAPLPVAMGSEAAAEGCYRFIRNSRVKVQGIMQPHFKEVAAMAVTGHLLILHDSTTILHRAARGADDVYAVGNGVSGYVAHVGLVVAERDGEPLGLVNLEVVERGQGPVPGADGETVPRGRESLRWTRGVMLGQHRLGRRDAQIVHVMDSEADTFFGFRHMVAGGKDFVVRATQDRPVAPSPGQTPRPLSQHLGELTRFGTREVEVAPRRAAGGPPRSKRNQGARSARTATVEVRGGTVQVFPPAADEARGAEPLSLQIVHVRELHPPAGEQPLDWLLWTSLPASTAEEAERVIVAYERRWLIEELFKALKTGCRFEERRFESRATSQNALGLYLSVAVHLLRLRHLARHSPERPAEDIVHRDHLAALRAMVPTLPPRPTVRDALKAIARVGGHLKHNGEPGWLVLARGYEKVVSFAEGWKAALAFIENGGEM